MPAFNRRVLDAAIGSLHSERGMRNDSSKKSAKILLTRIKGDIRDDSQQLTTDFTVKTDESTAEPVSYLCPVAFRVATSWITSLYQLTVVSVKSVVENVFAGHRARNVTLD